MAYIATIEQIIEEAQTYLDFDPRFWDQSEGVFEYGGEKIAYVRLPDEFLLTIDGAQLAVPRP